MLTKELLITTINNLSEPFTFDDVLDKLLLIEKIEKGIEQSENEQIISEEEMNDRVQSWLI